MTAPNELKLGRRPVITDGRDAVHIAIVPVVAKKKLRPGAHVDATGDTTGKLVGIVDPFMLKSINKDDTFWCCLYQSTIRSLRHAWVSDDFPEETPTPPDQDAPPADKPWLTAEVKALQKAAEATTNYQDYRVILQTLVGELEDNGYTDQRLLALCKTAKPTEFTVKHVFGILNGDQTLVEAVTWVEGFAAELDQTPNKLMEAATLWVESEEWTNDPSESYKGIYDADTKWSVFWQHFETLTGKKPKSDEDRFFTCSC